MARRKQLEFKGLERPKDWFGGSNLTSNPKKARPLDSKFATHLVLRAQKSLFRLPRYFKLTNETVRRVAAKYGVRVYDYSNNGNHLHILIKLPHRRVWAAFIRELSSRLTYAKGLWRGRPFTRIVRGWRRAYRVVKDYVLMNQLEALGIVVRVRDG